LNGWNEQRPSGTDRNDHGTTAERIETTTGRPRKI